MPWRKYSKAEQGSPVKLLAWVMAIGLLFGLLGLGELPEDLLRASRNSLHAHKASGDIVLVKFDDESLRRIGRWPWPRRHYAELTDRLTAAGSRRIFFDVVVDTPSNPADDQMFVDALARSGRVTLPVMVRSGLDGGTKQDLMPLPMFGALAELGSISVSYNYQNAVWTLPYDAAVGGTRIPSYAAKLAGKRGPEGASFTPDYSLDPASIPSISAAAVLSGAFDPRRVRGKDVIIGATTEALGDQYFIPGNGKMGGAYVQIIGAETLKSGKPVNLGWLPLFVAAVAIAAAAVFSRSGVRQASLLGGSTGLLFVGPAFAEAHLVTLDITPALFVVLTVSWVLGWRGFRRRGLVNPLSELPNLNALRSEPSGHDQAVLVARVINYAEIASALPIAAEQQLVDQIVARLRVGAAERTIYHGDGGIFAWFDEPRRPFRDHIEALHALFRTPARVAGMPIDLSLTFGIEIGSRRSLSNRLASAVVAAEEAAHDGLKWKYYDPDLLQDASWRLSMLSQLDSAIDRGEVWVAFQPKLDLRTRRIVGAEALARWTHPEKGPIAASEFVAAAEQHDRIGKLTDFVLEQAVSAAASLNRRAPGFTMAVNLSARLLSDRGLPLRLKALLARNRYPAEQLTLELTETAALAEAGSALDMLATLRELGVTISIDDYGTGLSTLDYLKKVPASEIKIDQSFVRGMMDNRSDRLMVQSTIGLAHSLGRKVVAEGVERSDLLEALTQMTCDVAQGFIIGRPMSVESLAKRLASGRRSQVA